MSTRTNSGRVRYSVPRHILRAASRLNAQYLADYAEYLAACEEDYRAGYRARYCEHGTNNWTDYDNICGGCEDGITMSDGMQRMRRAIDAARNAEQKVTELLVVSEMMDRHGVEYDRAAYKAMLRKFVL